MEFGPEIKVDGKRPEWLKDDKSGIAHQDGRSGRWFGIGASHDACWTVGELSHQDWITTSAIRLPVNHPHYANPTPDERAVALIRKIAKGDWSPGYETEAEARAIVAALEPVVDEDLVEARKVVADLYTGGNVAHLREQALSGEGDEWFHTKVAKAALARGRALASRDVTPCTREQFEDACRV